MTTAMIPREQTIIDVHGAPAYSALVEVDGQERVMVAIAPFCDFFGVDSHGQWQRIERTPTLNRAKMVCILHTISGDKPHNCIDLSRLHFWLATTSASAVKRNQEVFEAIQEESADALYHYWMGRRETQPSVPLTEQIRELLREELSLRRNAPPTKRIPLLPDGATSLMERIAKHLTIARRTGLTAHALHVCIRTETTSDILTTLEAMERDNLVRSISCIAKNGRKIIRWHLVPRSQRT